MTATPGPFFDPPVRVGQVFDVDECLTYLRAAFHEPLPFVTAQDTIARHFTIGLLDQPGWITPETQEAVAKALMMMGAQFAAIAAGGPALINILGMAGMHLLDGDLR